LNRSATEIDQLYKERWQVELLFKWLKQNLKIRSFLGRSATFRCADQDRETSPGLVRGPFVMTWIPPGGGPYRLCGHRLAVLGHRRPAGAIWWGPVRACGAQ